MIDSVVNSSMKEFGKKLKSYTKLHRISNVPDGGHYTNEIAGILHEYVWEQVEKNGLVSLEESLYSEPCLRIREGSSNHFIFKIL